MKVLMLGWEFPPWISGGLGTACFGLTKALAELGAEILFVLPRSPDQPMQSHVRFLTPPRRRRRHRAFAKPVRFESLPSELRPYGRHGPETLPWLPHTRELSRVLADPSELEAAEARAAEARIRAVFGSGNIYDGNVLEKADRYAELVLELAEGEDFDVIHAHDWMTFPAGVALSRRSSRPLVVHVHATEFDRTGPTPNPSVFALEQTGTASATLVFAVSQLTRGILVSRYGVPTDKIEVVYNAVLNGRSYPRVRPPRRAAEPIVLFLGRVTMQKGPEYFLLTARKLLEANRDVRFVMAGNGDRLTRMIEMSAELGLGGRVLFTGFLRGEQVEQAYRLSDVYVMPSVSEPFGITPLEAMLRGVPSLISQQSGVAEVLAHALKSDYWDTQDAADKLAAVLRDPVLYRELSIAGLREARGFNWREPARRCLAGYRRAICAFGRRSAEC